MWRKLRTAYLLKLVREGGNHKVLRDLCISVRLLSWHPACGFDGEALVRLRQACPALVFWAGGPVKKEAEV